MIGVLGGSFDPIHYGHLRGARELQAALSLDEIRFVPVARPPHRTAPVAAASDRLAMLRIAIENEPRFVLDDRELRRPGPSYTIDTLESLRAENRERTICLLLGADAFLGLASWHRWQALWDCAHIVVMPRPDVALTARLPEWASARLCAAPGELARLPAGRLWIQPVTPQSVSSTQLRESLARGESIDDWLPPAVLDYIHQHHLYDQTRGG